MSTKAKKHSTKPVKTTMWHEVSSQMMGDRSRLVARHPKNARAVFAGIGMVCSPSGGCGALAVIEAMTKDFCIVRFENGTPDAYFWGEVDLCAVQPRPSYIAGKGGRR